jgi:hypothetical protein
MNFITFTLKMNFKSGIISLGSIFIVRLSLKIISFMLQTQVGERGFCRKTGLATCLYILLRVYQNAKN